MNKQQRIDELLALNESAITAKELKTMSAREVQELHESVVFDSNDEVDGEYHDDVDENGNVIPEDGEELTPVTGSRVKETYRKIYANRAKEQGHVAKTVAGRATLNNGDELALLLEHADPRTICLVCDMTHGYPTGATYFKYTADRIGQTDPKTGVALKALNDGMVRMNAGNRIRSYCKKHEDPQVALSQVKTYLNQIAKEEAEAEAILLGKVA